MGFYPFHKEEFTIGNLDLTLLTDYKLSKNWDAEMRLVTAVADPDQQGKAQDFLEKLIDLGRFPNSTAVVGHRAVPDVRHVRPAG